MAKYVAEWGNDSNSGDSWENAYKTLSTGGRGAIARGHFFEHNIHSVVEAEILGCCIIDAQNFDVFINKGGDLKNIILQNFNSISAHFAGRWASDTYNCYIKNGNHFDDKANISHSIFESIFELIGFVALPNKSLNNTFHNISELYIKGVKKTPHQNKSIISNSNIKFRYPTSFTFSLFINSKFQFTEGNNNANETEFTHPTGNTDKEKLDNLKQRMSVVYGGNPNDYLKGCKYYSGSYNDIFVDAYNGNFDLVEGCIATYMSYKGGHIGARPVGKQIAIQDCTLTNIDTDGNIIDQTVNAQAISPIRRIGYKAEITSIKLLANLAYRNGQRANTERILGEEIQAGSNVLTAGKVYECYNDNIVIDNTNNTILQAFEGYTAVDEGNGAGLGFSGNGVMREVNIYAAKPKMKFKFSQNDATLNNANLITLYINEIPKVNLDADKNILCGNADANFDSENAVNLVTDYYQVFVEIQANDLTSR